LDISKFFIIEKLNKVNQESNWPKIKYALMSEQTKNVKVVTHQLEGALQGLGLTIKAFEETSTHRISK